MNWNKIFFYFALTGWILGFIVHILSILKYDVSNNIPFVWILLHLGVFVVWIPMVLQIRNNHEYQNFKDLQVRSRERMNLVNLYKLIFKAQPRWVLVIVITGFFYAFFNFFYSFFYVNPHSLAFENGQYILHNHGQVIRIITKDEYHKLEANILRGFSGHWMAFYGIAAAYFFPFRKQEASNL